MTKDPNELAEIATRIYREQPETFASPAEVRQLKGRISDLEADKAALEVDLMDARMQISYMTDAMQYVEEKCQSPSLAEEMWRIAAEGSL